jgi:hypothetical protein
MQDLLFTFAEDLWLYRGKVTTPATAKDNRIQVQVLPHMSEIEQRDLYPFYPPFFKNEFIQTAKDDIVWLYCTEDFTIGYILGLASRFSYDDSPIYYSKLETLINKLNDIEMNYGLGLTSVDLLHCTYWDDNVINFVNKKTGSIGNLHSSGALHMVSGKGSIVDIVNNSIVYVGSDEVSLTAPTIRLNGKVVLGQSGQSIVTTPSSGSATVGGMTLNASDNIKG